MSTWTLTYDGETKSLAEWGFSRAERVRQNLAPDEMRLFRAQSVTAGCGFTVGAMVIITRASATWFRGRVTQVSRTVSGTQHGIQLVISGPWWWLDNLVYQDTRTFARNALFSASSITGNYTDLASGKGYISSADIDPVSTTSSMGLLNQTGGESIRTDEQLEKVLQFAIDAGAPFTIGTIDEGVTAPVEKAIDMTCGEVIRRSLRWTPDVASWTDYTTNPPTLKFRRRSERTAHQIDLADGTAEIIALTPLYSAQVPGVRINWLQEHQAGNFTYQTLTPDSAGNPDEIGGMIVTMEIPGNTSYGEGSTIGFMGAAPIPSGIAARLFAALGTLSWQGQITLHEQEPGDVNWIARNIAIAGGAPEWESITPDVQSVSEEVFSGVTTISLGPPARLGAQDLMTLQRLGARSPGLGAATTRDIADALQGGGQNGAPTNPPSGAGNRDPHMVFSPMDVDFTLTYHDHSFDAYATTGQPGGDDDQYDVLLYRAVAGGPVTDSLNANGDVGTVTRWHNYRIGHAREDHGHLSLQPGVVYPPLRLSKTYEVVGDKP